MSDDMTEEVSADIREIVEALKAYALQHNLVLPKDDYLYAHAAKYVKLGHCPCDETRPNCPCAEALADIDVMGRCACGMLIDPMRLLRANEPAGETKSD